MEKIKKSFETIVEEAYDYQEALKRQNLKQEDVDRLREEVKGSKYVPQGIIDKQLLLFLNAFKNDIVKSAKMLDSYYKCKSETPEFFRNRDVESKEVQSSLDHQDYFALPTTPENYALIFHRLSSYEPKHYIFDEAVKTFILTVEGDAYLNGPRDGAIYLIDLAGVRFTHLFQPGVNSIRKGIRFLEDGNPFDIKAIHILNGVPFFDMILGLIRPFCQSSILSKVHFHSPNMDYEKFYKECIPKSHLPSDFGGDLESVEALHKRHRGTLSDMRDYFLFEEIQQHYIDTVIENTKMQIYSISKDETGLGNFIRFQFQLLFEFLKERLRLRFVLIMSIEIFKKLFHKSYDAIEACKRQNLDADSLEALRERMKTTKFAPKCVINSQLLLFLNAAKGDIEIAALKLDKYYELKHATPEFFQGRDIDSKEIQQCLDCLILVSLPVTPDNCLVMCQKLRMFNPRDYNFDAACKTFIMKTEATTYQYGPRDGIIFIDDLDGVSIFHMLRPSLSSIRKGMRFLQEASPLEVKAIHIMNCVPFINKMIAMAKPYVRSEMFSKVHFHPVGMDMNEFQEKFDIPKTHLPSDYGGDLPSLEDLHVQQRKELSEMRDYFLMEQAHMNYEYDQYYDDFEKIRPRTLPKQNKDYAGEIDEYTRM